MKAPPEKPVFKYTGPEEDMHGAFYYQVGRDGPNITFWSDPNSLLKHHGNTWRGPISEARKLFKRIPHA